MQELFLNETGSKKIRDIFKSYEHLVGKEMVIGPEKKGHSKLLSLAQFTFPTSKLSQLHLWLRRMDSFSGKS